MLVRTYLRPSDSTIHLEVTAHKGGEGHAVDEHEEDDIASAQGALCLKGKADGEFSVVRNT